MRTFLTVLLLLFGLSLFSQRTYHIAITGNDNNVGTQASPFRNWSKINTIGLQQGDSVIIHAGTYRTTGTASSNPHCLIQNLNGSAALPITICNAAGEAHPVFNLDNITPTNSDPTALYFGNSRYVHIRGLRITGLAQIADGSGISRGFHLQDVSNCIIEWDEVDHIGGYGFYLRDGVFDCTFLNCDAHHCSDPNSPQDPLGGSNGFDMTGNVTASRNTFDGCRAWWISDDGFDTFKSDSTWTFKNCWAFWNGYIPGTFTPAADGNAFKLGPTNSDRSAFILKRVTNCLGFENKANGIDQNNAQCKFQIYNCTMYGNGLYGFEMGYHGEITQDLKNNIGYKNDSANLHPFPGHADGSFNTWNGGVTVSNADFLSVSSLGMDGPRQADGSLPYLPFMRLATGSDLINAGTIIPNVPYIPPTPDMGCFEYAATLTCNAGINQSIVLPSNLTLTGTYTATATPITSTTWSKVTGGSATISNSAATTTTVTGLAAGTYTFEFKVIDGNGNTVRDTMQAIVTAATPTAPTCSANTSTTITLPVSTAALTVTSASTDGGSITSYNWVKTSGSSTYTITNGTTANATASGLIAGTYVFTCTATANNSLTCTKTSTIIVNPAVVAPTAVAGNDQSIQLPTNSINLSASGSSGGSGSITGYQWLKVSGGAATITSPTSQNTSVTALVAGIYTFSVTVTASTGLTAKDTVQITVLPAANVPPSVSCSGNQSVQLPTSSATVSGTATDSDGTITGYLWSQVSGTAATISNPTSPTTTITNLVAGVTVFRLTVTDNNGATNNCTTQITTIAAPVTAPSCSGATSTTITLPISSAALVMTANSTDGGSISTYNWAKISGGAFTIVNGTTPNATATNLVAGTYLFRCTATANNALSCTTDKTIIVNAAITPPTVSCASDISIQLPTNSTTLNSTINAGSGSITSILWTKVSGGAATLTTPTTQNTGVTGLVAGIYLFKITVVGTTGTVADSMTVTVLPAANIPPVANCSSNQTVQLPTNTATISVTATDADGTITGYNWIQTSGTAATISNATSATTTILGLTAGVTIFRVTVTDNNGATANCSVQITTVAAPLVAPVANAGLDRSITLPVNSVTLMGSGTTTDGSSINSYLWTKLTGTGGSITSNTLASTPFTGLTAGIYTVELKVGATNGLYGRDTMSIVVDAAPLVPPSVSGGANMTITLPLTSTLLVGTATASSGSITGYSWAQTSGGSCTITSPTSASTTITGLTVTGVYKFTLTATQTNGLSATSAEVTVTVLPANATRTNVIFFQASLNSNTIDLGWTSNATSNTIDYTISRKVNNGFYKVISTIPPQKSEDYWANDNYIGRATLYYKCKSNDKQGTGTTASTFVVKKK